MNTRTPGSRIWAAGMYITITGATLSLFTGIFLYSLDTDGIASRLLESIGLMIVVCSSTCIALAVVLRPSVGKFQCGDGAAATRDARLCRKVLHAVMLVALCGIVLVCLAIRPAKSVYERYVYCTALDAMAMGDPVMLNARIDTMPNVVYARDDHGRSLLHWAVLLDKIDLVSELLSRGADVNARTYYVDLTPLHEAARKGSLAIARRLVEAGADSSSKARGLTPSDYAEATLNGKLAQQFRDLMQGEVEGGSVQE